MVERLPLSFDELEESILLFDTEGNPVDQNAAAESFLGYSDDSLAACSLETLVSGSADVPIDEIREQLAHTRDGESHFFEWQIHRANGEHRWVMVMLSPATFTSEPHVLAEVRDLTRYKARGRRIQLLYRVLRHNLRNDMTVIQGHASNLERAIKDEDLEEQIEVIKRTAERVGGFSDSVANLERLIERDATERRRVEVAELIAEVVAKIESEYPDVSIETDLDADLVISADDGLALAVEHTLDNAIRHNDADESLVTIEATTDDGSHALIRIVDNGPGIPEMELNALEGEVSDVEHGNGLGLWLIKRCTESLGGSVSFEEAGAAGTCVTLKIPLIKAA